jgi:excisionase family DNA binding protein
MDQIAPSSPVLIMSTVKPPASVPIAAARFLTVRGVADELGVSQYTVRRLIHDGTLAGIRVGSVVRVPRVSLETFLEEQRVTTK